MNITRLLLALVLVTCGMAHAEPAEAPAVAQELIGHAADDFRQHMQPPPSDFRRVRLGELKSADGSQRRWVLCGEFRPAGDKAPWARFATIKTSPYEHWVGGAAQGYCQPPAFKAQGADLSPALKARVAPR